jgi:CRISPR-associated exonuclease Cas4
MIMALKKIVKDSEDSQWAYTDAGESTITVTDIKHYFYCPKIIYFDKVIHAEPRFTAQQNESKIKHDKIEEKDSRRKAGVFYSKELQNAEKSFRVHMHSPTLRLEGVLDCLLKNGKEMIPIDYKYTVSKKGDPWPDHKYQITAYALLVEETYDTIVRRGFVYYIPEELTIQIRITESMKTYLKKIIGATANIIESEEEPDARIPASRCSGGCGFLWICGGIWNRRK